MSIEFSAATEAKFQALLTRYPNKPAALIPTLFLTQAEHKYLTLEALEYVAKRLDMPPAEVLNTATFYTMLYKKPVGKYHIEVCTNVSCFLRGCDDIVATLEKKLGVGVGETTPDKLFTLDEVQCLAACGTAPALQVNRRFHEEMTPQKAAALVDDLRKKG